MPAETYIRVFLTIFSTGFEVAHELGSMGLTPVDVVELLLHGSVTFKFFPCICFTFQRLGSPSIHLSFKNLLFHFNKEASFARNSSFSFVPGLLLRRAASSLFQLTRRPSFSGKSSLEMRSRLLEPRLSFAEILAIQSRSRWIRGESA